MWVLHQIAYFVTQFSLELELMPFPHARMLIWPTEPTVGLTVMQFLIRDPAQAVREV
jgi:hypothetical protein